MKKYKLTEEIKKGSAGIPYDIHLVLPGLYISRKLRKYKIGKQRAIRGLGVMMANILIGDLRKKYKKNIENLKIRINREYPESEHIISKKVWVCWLQGIENAPQVVKVCYQSILNNLDDREIVFSDILRLELLKKYGGTWIDATMFITDKNLPDYMLNDKLFICQSIEDTAAQIESFFITSESNNKIITMTLELLYKYWEKHNVLIHYLLMFYFFKIATEEFENEWADVIPFSRTAVKSLDYNLENPFNERVFKEILKITPIHKLTYKKPINDGSYFDYIIKHYNAYGE